MRRADPHRPHRGRHRPGQVSLVYRVGLLGELVNDDGTRQAAAAADRLRRKEHDLKIISIADLIAYRRTRERLVERTAEFVVETEIGPGKTVSYATPHLVRCSTWPGVRRRAQGQVAAGAVHRREVLADIFGRGGDASLIAKALARIQARAAPRRMCLPARGRPASRPQPEAADRARRRAAHRQRKEARRPLARSRRRSPRS